MTTITPRRTTGLDRRTDVERMEDALRRAMGDDGVAAVCVVFRGDDAEVLAGLLAGMLKNMDINGRLLPRVPFGHQPEVVTIDHSGIEDGDEA